jgi:hypothetical protein
LTYESRLRGNATATTLHFSISLDANAGSEGFGQFTTLDYTISLPLGTWIHAVGTYDGISLRLFVNGAEGASMDACAAPPCGRIVYPSRLSPSGDCRAGVSTFTIGTYDNPKDSRSYPHYGLLRSVRLMDKAVTSAEASDMYAAVRGYPSVSADEYWFTSEHADLNSTVRSPDRNYYASGNSTGSAGKIAVRGLFRLGEHYHCEFAYDIYNVGMPGPVATHVSSAPGTVNCTGFNGTHAVCPTEQHGDMLTCDIPEWNVGYRAPFVRVVRGAQKQAVWQRVCLDETCGRTYTTTQTISRHHSGKAARFYFLTLSALYDLMEEDQDSSALPNATDALPLQLWERVRFVQDFGTGNASCESCVYGETLCQGGALSGQECQTDQDCSTADGQAIAECNTLETFAVKGAASWRAVQLNGRQLLLVANYWDGVTRDTTSAVFEMLGKDPEDLILLQEVRTNGAREWEYVEVGGKPFVIVANSIGKSYAYALNPNSASSPVDTSAATALHPAMGIASFTFGSNTYIALASTSANTGTAYIYKLTLSSGTLQATLTQTVPLPSVTLLTDVIYFPILDKMYLAFASATGASPLLEASSTAANLSFLNTNQPLPTSGAVKIQYFAVGEGTTQVSHYIAAAQRTSDALLLMRWDGLRFLGQLPGSDILSGRTGGTAVPYSQLEAQASGITYIPGDQVEKRDGVLVVGLDDGTQAKAEGVRILSTLRDAVIGTRDVGMLRGPTAVEVRYSCEMPPNFVRGMSWRCDVSRDDCCWLYDT